MQWIWLVVLIIAIILDIISSDFLFAGFSIGGLVALMLAIFNVDMYVQIIVFGIVSALFIFLVYPKIKKKIAKDKLGTKKMEETYIGRVITVDKDLNTEALIKFEGIYWTFKSKDGIILQGNQVKIVSIEGNKLIVEKNKN